MVGADAGIKWSVSFDGVLYLRGLNKKYFNVCFEVWSVKLFAFYFASNGFGSSNLTSLIVDCYRLVQSVIVFNGDSIIKFKNIKICL